MEMGLPAEPCLCHAIHQRRSSREKKTRRLEATVGLEAGYSHRGDMRHERGAILITALIVSSPEQPLKELNGNRDCAGKSV